MISKDNYFTFLYILNTQQGFNLAERLQSKEDFQEWAKHFKIQLIEGVLRILSGSGDLILEYDGIIDEGQNLVYVDSIGKTTWIINEPAGSCVQTMLDNWCKG